MLILIRLVVSLGGVRLLEGLAQDGDYRIRDRPTGIEGEVRDHFDQLIAGDAVRERASDMARQFIGPVERNQAGNRDQAAVALGEAWPLPDLAEQYPVAEIGERRRDVAVSLLRGAPFVGHHVHSLTYCSSVTFSIQVAPEPFFISAMAMCVMAQSGAAPCQCFSFGSNQTSRRGAPPRLGHPPAARGRNPP